ncbi:Na(+)/citrate cotransporter-like [Amblyomma americanum]
MSLILEATQDPMQAHLQRKLLMAAQEKAHVHSQRRRREEGSSSEPAGCRPSSGCLMVASFLLHWSSHIIMAIPLLFFVPMVYIGHKPMLCAYVMLWMSIYWVSAVLPLGVTSLMPLVLFPLLGILSTEETTTSYFNVCYSLMPSSNIVGRTPVTCAQR